MHLYTKPTKLATKSLPNYFHQTTHRIRQRIWLLPLSVVPQQQKAKLAASAISSAADTTT